MLVFAHVGITLGLARSIECLIHNSRKNVKPSFNLDYRLVAVGSMLPDIIDKPLSYVLSETAVSGRIYAHSLLFLLLMLIIAVFSWRIHEKIGFLLVAGGVFVHEILDSMWLYPKTILWPLYGLSFHGGNPKAWVHFWWTELFHNPYVYVPEAVGCIIIIVFFFTFSTRR